MYRLLIVDDEEIITDGLYEVFSRLPEQLDVCRAYSAQEALDWMSRTRIDIVLTDIAMPGMNGLEMTETILSYWPRCRVIFLTGHSEFEYAYRAIQLPNVRYLLKTEGYDKVQDSVREAMQELHRGSLEYRLLAQSREQAYALEMMAQGDYLRQLLQESRAFCTDRESLSRDFRKLNIDLDPRRDVVLVLGRLTFPEGLTYSERTERTGSARTIWDTHLSAQIRSIGIADRYGDLLWFIQPSSEEEAQRGGHLLRYLEGTLELIQETCLNSLELKIGFTISGGFCKWEAVTSQHERLRRLQQFKMGEGVSIILRDQAELPDGTPGRESFLPVYRIEQMAAHLEAGRAAEFLAVLSEMTGAVPEHDGCAAAWRTAEAYYAVALVLYSYINRLGLHGRIDAGKLMRLDDHPSMREGFDYVRQVAEAVFRSKRSEERGRASHVIDRISQYIEDHIHEDLSLVRLAEIHYFNPSYLSRLFKQERGINLSEYIDHCRIVKAKALLRNGDLKIRDVSEAVGYEAAHSFTRFFKKMTGMTPQEYRDGLIVS
ncbi:hypothetical protein PACILC2_30740 [Paenibacillus cisolokensis]|uniref:AraC family transcriptional regulator n=1 Tax=Paenibacillus cisolokensis TaxID=1658519 RepID=A0ABQ4N8G9_9BACL|nr:response regulator [Paenibacillus cisolokensis]GIQ64506.1 hypothetical protein PACILC2_30740 [Paenibacillus cisolokensis]